jgi:2-oxoglutarate dehydrogenase E2 component (dihydrolipoamide succinyltransferase)
MAKLYGLALLAIALLGGASITAIELAARRPATGVVVDVAGARTAADAAAPAQAPAPLAAAAAPLPTPSPSPSPLAAAPLAAGWPAPGGGASAPIAIASDDADVEAERAERLAKRGRARRSSRRTATPE